MKRHLNRFFSFILAVSVLISTFLCCPISAYATHGGGGGSNHGTLTDEEKNEKLQEIINNSEKYLLFLCSQLSAHVNGAGYKEYFENYVEYEKSMGVDLYLENNIAIEDDGSISFSDDLVAAVKQALRDYSEETNGLYLAPTVNVHDIPIEFFSSSNRYHSLVDIVDTLGLAGVAYNGQYIVDLSRIHNNNYSFVANVTNGTEQDLINSPLNCRGFYSNETWGGPYGIDGGSTNTDSWYYGAVRRFNNLNNERCKWDDGIYPLTLTTLNSNYYVTGSLIFGYSNGKSLTNLSSYNPTSWSSSNAQYAVWSSDGRRVRVWKNEAAFIYGTENRRTVYFGKDFYNTTPSDITVSIDDLNESIENLDTVLDQLLEKIDNNTEESEIENLLQQILDEMKNSGGGGGGNQGNISGGGSSYDDSGLLSLLSGYFEQVLAYLKSISGTVSEGFSSLKGKLDNVSDKLSGGTEGSTDMGTVEDLLQQILDKIDGSTDISTIEDLLQQILDRADDFTDKSMVEDLLQQVLDKIDESTDKSTVEDLLQQILEELKNSNNAPEHWYDDIIDYLDKILSQLKSIKRWAVIDTVIDGVDAIADWFDLIHDILSDADNGMESAVSTLSSALDEATGLLKKKFPFSVPWDIFFFVTLLAAEPETPHFEVPIDFDVSSIDMQVHYDFVVDFADYQYLSDIFRVILSMTYAVGLLKMTAGIVNTRKEE